ncbi:MAG: protein-disulfide reductase DsbD family protein [Pseudomonadales bacterium]
MIIIAKFTTIEIRIPSLCILLAALIAAIAFVSSAVSAQSVKQDPFSSALISQADDFLPVDQAYQLLVEGSKNETVDFSWAIAEGYYLYRHAFAAKSHAKDDSESELAMDIPAGKAKTDEYFGDVEVYYHNAMATVSVPSGDARLSIRYQGCADAGLCYPPKTRYFERIAGQGFMEVDSFSTGAGANSSLKQAVLPASDGETSFWAMALFAFLGGAILNLMPCVFPVLALKVLGLVNASSVSLREQRAHGLSYTAGVVASFLAMAGLLLALRAAGEALGWGFQLQTPWLVALLVYLFFALGLSMSGFVEFGASWAGVGQQLTEKSGHSGSFFTGVLAVVVASPCTAPFMGAALGFALVQPPIMALTIFAALGLGMAAPFLLLVGIPALARGLPRPGAWMNTFKEWMAIPLFITAIWLIWVVGRQTGVNGMALVLCGCVLIYMALWFWQAGSLAKRAAAVIALILAIAALAGPWLQQRTEPTASAGSVYSAERVLELRASGKPVFVNFTADWCITCLANERVALSQDAVLSAFRDGNVAYLKGDWTNSDPAITEVLAQYGRSGVPLYLLFPADPSAPATVLPQILTTDIVLGALHRLKQEK